MLNRVVHIYIYTYIYIYIYIHIYIYIYIYIYSTPPSESNLAPCFFTLRFTASVKDMCPIPALPTLPLPSQQSPLCPVPLAQSCWELVASSRRAFQPCRVLQSFTASCSPGVQREHWQCLQRDLPGSENSHVGARFTGGTLAARVGHQTTGLVLAPGTFFVNPETPPPQKKKKQS